MPEVPEVPAMGGGAAGAPADAAHWTRRRVIRMVAAAAGLPLMIATVRAPAPAQSGNPPTIRIVT